MGEGFGKLYCLERLSFVKSFVKVKPLDEESGLTIPGRTIAEAARLELADENPESVIAMLLLYAFIAQQLRYTWWDHKKWFDFKPLLQI